MDKIALFIDGGYLAKILRNEFDSAKIDFQKLQENIAEGNTLFRTYYLICPSYRSDPPTEQKKLVNANQARFTV